LSTGFNRHAIENKSSTALPCGIGGKDETQSGNHYFFAYLLITCGCAVAVLGLGAAAGTGGAYVAGKDTRIYDSEYHQTAQACMETLSSLKIPVSQTPDSQTGKDRIWEKLQI